jgi:hypothetical protein
MSLREQRGKDDPSHSRQRTQNRRVALLGYLPRVALRGGERLDESVQATGDFFELAIDQLTKRRRSTTL